VTLAEQGKSGPEPSLTGASSPRRASSRISPREDVPVTPAVTSDLLPGRVRRTPWASAPPGRDPEGRGKTSPRTSFVPRSRRKIQASSRPSDGVKKEATSHARARRFNGMFVFHSGDE